MLPSVIPQGLEDGRVRNLLALTSEDFDIEGIASRLARINRYAGATHWPYSVALHSVLVSYLAEPVFQMAGLVHDIPEAFGIGDLIAPIKRADGLQGYRELEESLVAQLVPAFPELALHRTWCVRNADERAYQLECLFLRGRWPDADHTRYSPPRVSVREDDLGAHFLSREWAWTQARDVFMARYEELRNG